jgi:hypothetical protein
VLTCNLLIQISNALQEHDVVNSRSIGDSHNMDKGKKFRSTRYVLYILKDDKPLRSVATWFTSDFFTVEFTFDNASVSVMPHKMR